jgi:hypothetical protein
VGARGIQWFNTAAFTIPAKYTYGNAARTIPGIFGPGLVNFDMMLGKNFYFLERYRAQFRWEAFNFSNTPAWGQPNTTLGTGTFGAVTSAGGRRIMQFSVKLYW